MKHLLGFTVLVILTAGARSQTDAEAQVSVVHGTNTFGKNWYQIASSQPGNVLISPGSASFVLGMLWNGARGLTQSQIRDAFLLPEDFETTNLGYSTVIQSLSSVGNENVTLELANKLFIGETFSIYQTYLDILTDTFQSSIDRVNFSGDPQGSVDYINDWVNITTRGTIPDIFSYDEITSATVLVLANAIYFFGKWRTAFDPELTSEEQFYISNTESTTVQMMHVTAEFKYIDMGDYEVLELPYGTQTQGDELSMWVILPKQRDGLQELESNIHNINLTIINNTLEARNVSVYLPRFTFASTIEMNEPLNQLGMVDMFTAAANFSGISSSHLMVSDVKQKTFIEVTEEGTEAAAVTTVGIVVTSLPIVTQFRADHPFMYMIKPKSLFLLFLGRYSAPE